MSGSSQHDKDIALLMASEAGDLDRATALLTAGASSAYQDSVGRTALMAATQQNHLALAGLLIRAGADVNQRDITRLSPYLCAGVNGFRELMRRCLAAGADVTSVNRFGGTVLLPASEKGYLKTVQIALQHGVPERSARPCRGWFLEVCSAANDWRRWWIATMCIA